MAAVTGRGPAVPQSNLHQQDLSKLDISKLSALSQEVISRQATINIGTIGHVAHGKSTVVKAISGVQTVRFKNELERNITIKLERLTESQLLKLTKESRKRRVSDDENTSKQLKQKRHKKSRCEQQNGEYIVEDIVDQKFFNGIQMFFVKWKNWQKKYNTWEPIENLGNCLSLVSNFLDREFEKTSFQLEQLKSEITFGDLLNHERLEKLFQEEGALPLPEAENFFKLDLFALNNLPPEEENFAGLLVTRARLSIQKYELSVKRKRQLEILKEWEVHLNKVDTAGKLRVENDFDLSLPPLDFQYINKSVPGEGVVIPEEPPIGCECLSCNAKCRSCCGLQGGFFPYFSNKQLRVDIGTPIYECNKSCKCSSDCNNRVVQNGRSMKLCIFRTKNGCGWGVRSESRIRKSQFICQYVGEVISSDEAERRGRTYDQNGLTYLFDLDFNSSEIIYTIDAANMGNVSHFINHSCDPNLAVWAVWGNCLDPNIPMLALFTTREIEPGEELCFDYNQKTHQDAVTDDEYKNVDDKNLQPLLNHMQSPVKAHLVANTICLCGAKICRGYLF